MKVKIEETITSIKQLEILCDNVYNIVINKDCNKFIKNNNFTKIRDIHNKLCDICDNTSNRELHVLPQHLLNDIAKYHTDLFEIFQDILKDLHSKTQRWIADANRAIKEIKNPGSINDPIERQFFTEFYKCGKAFSELLEHPKAPDPGQNLTNVEPFLRWFQQLRDCATELPMFEALSQLKKAEPRYRKPNEGALSIPPKEQAILQ